MGFLTELFSRPRPRDPGRIRAITALSDSVRGTGRTDSDIRPSDFPRIPRRFAAT